MPVEYGSDIERIATQAANASRRRTMRLTDMVKQYVQQSTQRDFRTPIRSPRSSPGKGKPLRNGPPVGMGPQGISFLREAFDPLKSFTITSGYGPRENPFSGGHSFHEGIDLAAPQGTPVYASASGRVGKRTGWSDIYGNEIMLQHGKGWKTGYHHLVRSLVRPGQRVRRGQLIGYVGSTGWSTGPHLHWSIYRKGQHINPRKYLRGR